MSRPRTLLVASSALVCLMLSACEAPRQPPRPSTWAPTPVPTHVARPMPTGTGEGASGSLLDEYSNRESRELAETKSWDLPTNGKTIVVETLIAAANDDPHHLLAMLTQDASWGVPDRRQMRARPISTKDDPLGSEFLTALRTAASRFASKASFTCTPLQPNWGLLADSGAEPMWCSYNSKDGLDLIVYRLVKEQGQVRVDYIGLFPERQAVATYLADAGYAPPITPYTKLPVVLELPKLDEPAKPKQPAQPAQRDPAKAARPGAPADAPIPVEGNNEPDKPIAVEADGE